MKPRRWAKWLLGEYTINRIYTIGCGEAAEPEASAYRIGPLESPKDFATATDAAVRKTASYLGEESYGLGVWVDEELVSACFVWSGDRYRQGRNNYWPLRPEEAKLVQVVTAERFRGRGIATQLCRRAPVEMGKRGFARLFARVWHSNAPSIQAFERAGWQRAALVVEVNPLHIGKPWRFIKRTGA